MSRCKYPGVPRGLPPGMAADKCITITELVYSRILNMISSCLHTEVSGVYTPPFLDTDELKMAFTAPQSSRAFEKRTPVKLF